MATLVTGGAGFIGSHVVNDLLAMDEEVIVLDDLSGGFKENVNPRAKLIEGSITNALFIKKIFQEHRIEYVFHLAAYAAEGLSHFIKRFNYENNLIGSVNLINASVNNNVQSFVFTSSIAVYGSGQLPFGEDMIPTPEDSYGIAKLAVEQELEVSKHMFGLDYIIFRPHNVYGEYQNIGDKYRNVVGIFMNQVMQGEPLTIFGDGTQTYNQIFNFGGDEVVSVHDLAKAVCRAFGVEPNITYLYARKEVKYAHCDHAKVKRVFGNEPKYTLEQGIRTMAEWAKKAGPRQSKKFSNIEILKNLPPSWA